MRAITFKIQIMEIQPDKSEKVIHEYKPETVCYNRHHLKNLLLIAISKIIGKFERKEL